VTAPPDGLTLRAARADDADGIAELQGLPFYRFGTLRTPFPSPADVRRWLESRAPGSLALVASLDGRIVANGGLERFAGRRLHAATLGMGVHDDYCGRGIGRALLSALLDAADNWLDIRRIELGVFTDNHAAIRLYESAGFRIEGTSRAFAFRDGRYVDAYAMARLRDL
jgi:L-phenylalanine/L-methionine N-acetyltransferase